MVEEDLELVAGITPEEGALDDLADDLQVGVDADGGGADNGGSDGGIGALLEPLTTMTGLLAVAVAALGLIALVPGLLEGVLTLIEKLLTPISALVIALLTPLIQRLLRWLVQNDIIGMMEQFAQTIVTNVSSVIETVSQVLSQISNLVSTIQQEGVLSTLTGAGGGGGGLAGAAVSGAQDTAAGFNPGNVGPALANPLFALFAGAEFTMHTLDEWAGQQNSDTTQEDGPG